MGETKKNSNTQITFGAIISYIAIAVNMLSGLIYTPWMIKQIGQSDYGLYTLATSCIAIFMMDFGLGSAVSRFISKYLAENKQNEVNNFLGVVYKLYIIIDLVIMIILTVCFFFLGTVYPQLNTAEISKFKILFIIVGFSNLISFPFVPLNGILTSYEKFIQLKLCNIVHKLIIVFGMIIALLCGCGVYALVMVNAVSNVLIIIIKFIIIKSKTSVKANFKYKNSILMKEIFSFSFWTTLLSVAQRLVFNLTPSILAAVSGTGSITVFGLASTLEGYIYNISDGINGLFLPKVSRIISNEKNRDESIMQLMVKVGRINLIIISLFIVGFICAGQEFITLWLGEDYITVYYVTIMLIITNLIYSPQQIARTQLIAENKIKYQALVNLFVNAVHIIILVCVGGKLGAIGAGISIGISCVLRLIIMNYIFKTKISIDVKRFFKKCTLSLLPAIILFWIIGTAIFSFIPFSGWVMFFIKVILISIVYIIILFTIGMNEYEKKLFLGIFKKIRRKI